MSKISTEPYKGVRDFYPEDMAIQNYIFGVWRKVAESFGYSEYSASLLEPADLYRSKSGDEIVNEQMFTFTDRGDREVALRPEMTPTLARMVAGIRKSAKFPLRWFSMPNLFRYEKPQRGRKREHWQLNCDVMGIAGIDAEVEIISLAYKIMKEFGAKDEYFEIQINSRDFYNAIAEALEIEDKNKLAKLIDQRRKMDGTTFMKNLSLFATLSGENSYIVTLLDTHDIYEVKKDIEDTPLFTEKVKTALNSLINTIEKLKTINIKTKFSFDIMRGFDYYTGMVFEVFDTSPENNRSLFGGGRYDNLLEIFGVEPIPTVGFGMGDVTIRDFLETHNLPLSEKK